MIFAHYTFTENLGCLLRDLWDILRFAVSQNQKENNIKCFKTENQHIPLLSAKQRAILVPWVSHPVFPHEYPICIYSFAITRESLFLSAKFFLSDLNHARGEHCQSVTLYNVENFIICQPKTADSPTTGSQQMLTKINRKRNEH